MCGCVVGVTRLGEEKNEMRRKKRKKKEAEEEEEEEEDDGETEGRTKLDFFSQLLHSSSLFFTLAYMCGKEKGSQRNILFKHSAANIPKHCLPQQLATTE